MRTPGTPSLKFLRAMEKNELKKYLMGIEDYSNADADLLFNPIICIADFYDYYRLSPESKVDDIFVETLLSMLSDPYEILVAVYYTTTQMSLEHENKSPFKVGETYFKKLKRSILENKEKLERFDSEEFGKNGMNFINSSNDGIFMETGRKFM